MAIGKILREMQPAEYERMVAAREDKEEYEDRETRKFERMMKEGNVYKRGKGGAMKQVR